MMVTFQVAPIQAQEIHLTEVPKDSGSPPMFVQPITSIDAGEGQRVIFETVVTGTPVPQIRWFREQEEITESLDFQVQCL